VYFHIAAISLGQGSLRDFDVVAIAIAAANGRMLPYGNTTTAFSRIAQFCPCGRRRNRAYLAPMLTIDLRGRRALVAGIADGRGFGFAIAKELAAAGAKICAATWPPAYRSFSTIVERNELEPRPDGTPARFEFERIYPLDARYDTRESIPEDLRSQRRYKELDRYSIEELAGRLREDFGERPLDVVVHCVANGPEALRPLLDTSRDGYLAAVSTSSYSFVSMVQRLAPLMRPGGSFACISFVASQRVVPGYGGGMSSAKAALEADTRVLAFEVGRRYGLRVNCISAGPCASSRAAAALGFVDEMASAMAKSSPLPESIRPSDVGGAALFLASPLARAITGSTVYVDYGSHAMSTGVL
jgi:enoyl-[acyl-carrier protein] reductase I